ncbi:hypothetical protein PENFLA_c009G05528 [Penicillium flavigenum]|uniref:Uncharacterized protein n=1 Tax=Penicillium flavigenum TaxID=254877 RepID=A0A1V6TGZ1_9EURO|nr:hypothetical protein PENFLA_c009G05528 [Penicillium flavigenum]
MASIQGAIPITELHSIPIHATPYGRGNTAPIFTSVDILKSNIAPVVCPFENAVYGGREAYGYPKVLGDIDFDLKKNAGVMAFVTATVSRPISNPIVEFLCKPSNYIITGPIPPPENVGLNLRLIPNIITGAKPSVRQFVPITFKALEGERWEGVGSLRFPSMSTSDPLHKTPVVEYLRAELLRNCTCVFAGRVTEVFDF